MRSRATSTSVRRTAAALAAALFLSAGAAVAADVEGLLFDMQIVPLDGLAPQEFALPALDGKRVTLSDLKGHVILVYFWATW